MFNSQQLQIWRNKNIYYYQDIENLCKFFVQPDSRVLDVGAKLGHLLAAVKPSYGLGIDSNSSAVEQAREKYPHFEFEVANPEEFVSDQLFDYILLTNTISSLDNIQQTFSGLHKVCNSSTRLIITFHNPAWELILRLATILRQRMPLSSSSLNWLNLEDVENILYLTDFQVIEHGKRFLFPKKFPFLASFLNKFIAPLPFLNALCLTEYVIARPNLTRRFNTSGQVSTNKLNELTCSVIVPARNESNNIEGCVARLPKLGKHTEIIFIEGHSSDETWAEIQRVQAKYQDQWDIKICQQTGKGKGNAVREGFAMATGDVFIILDSDLTVRPEDLIYFFEAIADSSCEFANGCRLIYPVSSEAMPWLNRMANRFFAWLLSYLLNTKIKDSLCGTKAIKKEHYKKIAQNRHYFGDFDPFGDFDLLFGASKLGLQIQDIPIRYVPRSYGQSNIQHFKEGLVLLKMCLYAAQKIKFI
ncbi:MAG: glycosyl transferase [Snowella sp.]|nr:MAG: glycosyl transferase [Snowella sp.]